MLFQRLRMHALGIPALKRNLIINGDADYDTTSRNNNDMLLWRYELSRYNFTCLIRDSMSIHTLAAPGLKREILRPAALTKAFLRNRKQRSFSEDSTHRHQAVSGGKSNTAHAATGPGSRAYAPPRKPA